MGIYFDIVCKSRAPRASNPIRPNGSQTGACESWDENRDRNAFVVFFDVLIAESWPGIIAGLTVTVVSLIGYSAMAGTVGGGGLGDLGIRYGYQRFQPEIMIAVVLVLIVLVQSFQTVRDALARKLNKRLIRSDRR
jgi:D-methionine transport system permease protein